MGSTVCSRCARARSRSVAPTRSARRSGPKLCDEILQLHVAAILAAQRLIYLETQYFSSHAICEALEQRMRDAERPALEIVMVLNMRGETLKEQVAVGLAQAQIIGRLRLVASETPHQLGIFYTLPACDAEEARSGPPTSTPS